jgi:two-component system NtrC family response regulator
MSGTRAERRIVLVVDDDESFRAIVAINLDEEGHEVLQASSGEKALERFSSTKVDLVLTDLRMPGIDGYEVLRKVKYARPSVPVIVITAFGSIEGAVEAMRLGAANYLTKPFDRREFKAIVRETLAAGSRGQIPEFTPPSGVHHLEGGLVYASEAMGRVVQVVDRIADSESTVLIVGESGTGKEMVARLLHARSGRSQGPFVAVNCAAIPHDLIESELFGHRRGAFSGAVNDRLGRFREADGGTLLLDEVGELDLALQAKLLRVLDRHEVDVLGGDRPVEVDVRVVAATNRDMETAVQSAAFREDLYYRLNVLTLELPTLRDRAEDIEPLARYFLGRLPGGGSVELPQELIEALGSHRWPGNVRELANVIERAFYLRRSDGITAGDLPSYMTERQEGRAGLDIDLPDQGVDLKELEADVIRRALEKNGWNQSATARYLNIPRHVLLYRIEKFGITPPEK